jgi:hypothetical protein
MSDSFIGSILTHVLPWEDKAICICGSQWYRVVAVVHFGQSKLLEIPHKSGENVSLWHIKSGILVELLKLLHHHEAEVLVANIEHHVWSALIDSLWDPRILHSIENMVTVFGEVLVDEVEGVPFEVDTLIKGLAFPVGMEGLIEQVVHINIKTLLEAFVCHVFSIQKYFR